MSSRSGVSSQNDPRRDVEVDGTDRNRFMLYPRLQGLKIVSRTMNKHVFIDIGVNLTDPVFTGSYWGKQAHTDDFQQVIQRARNAGVIAQIVTGGSLSESKQALSLSTQHPDLYCTVGCHPTRTTEMESDSGTYICELKTLIESSEKIIAVGECGLDYDRLEFSLAGIQKKHFTAQLELAKQVKLPLFLHSRAAHADFVDILGPKIAELTLGTKETGAKRVGVVHSFTGTVDELKELLALGLMIGVNGCSLKTEESLEVVRQIPLDRMLLETAGNSDLYALYMPKTVKKEKWTQDCMVKGRNEPCVIGLIAATVASIKSVSVDEVVQAAKSNTEWLFGISV